MQINLTRTKNIDYFVQGEGKPVVLLHGLMGALSNWESVIHHFSKKYKVYVPLLPILKAPLFRANLSYLVKFLARFIRATEIDNFLLVGNSLGGHLALMYALKHKKKMHSMLLTASSGLYEDSFGGSFPRRGDYNYIKEKIEYTFYDPAVATDELVDYVFKIVNDRANTLRIISFARSAIRHNMGNDLHKIDVPTALIWGKNDKITPPYVAEEFNEKLPNSTLYWVDKCGHAPMMEHPKEFNLLMEQFMEKVNY